MLRQVEHVESAVEVLEFQELACEIIRQAWLDAGTHRPREVREALQFALSRDFDIWCELAEVSDENRDRIRLDIEIRAEASQGKRQAYLAKQRERRAS